jgi:hypothetical protein
MSCGVGFLRFMFNDCKLASGASVPNAFTSVVLMVVAPAAVVFTASIIIDLLVEHKGTFN